MTRNKLSVFFAAALLAAVAGADSFAAEQLYLELEGNTVGPIDGYVTANEFANQIEVFEFHHLLRDPAGKVVVHEQVVFTTRLGKATPLIMQAWDSGEPLTQCVFSFLRDVNGNDVHYLTVELQGGRIAAVEPITPSPPSTEDLVRVRIAYDQLVATDPVPSGAGSVTLDNPQIP